jgi:DNA gyrase subunit A
MKIKKKLKTKGAGKKPAPKETGGTAVIKGARISLGALAKQNIVEYGTYTLMDRAIPMLYDGLKPVHRRIIYAMQDMGLHFGNATRKSATVVGEVMGKYHPHGDVAIYDSMVTLSTGDGVPFPLIHGQGNWGNFDGSPAAAHRYTECKLTKFSSEHVVPRAYMSNAVIPYRRNYDDSHDEPVYLPSQLPTLFLIGASGIATGASVDMPAYTYESVLAATKCLFKTGKGKKAARKLVPVQRWGAQLLSTQAEIDAYHKTGRGSLSWGAPYTVDRKGNQTVIKMTGVPPTTEIGWGKLAEQIQNMKGVYSVIDVSDETMLIEITIKDEAVLPAVKKKLVKSASYRSAITVLTDKSAENETQMVKFEDWSPIQILEAWRTWRIELEKLLIKHLISVNDAEIHRLNLLILAASKLDVLFEILKAKSGDKIAMIENKLKVSNEDAKTIWQLAVGRLDRLNAEETKAKVAELEKTNRSLKKDYKVPAERILRELNNYPVVNPNVPKVSKAKKRKAA